MLGNLHKYPFRLWLNSCGETVRYNGFLKFNPTVYFKNKEVSYDIVLNASTPVCCLKCILFIF